MTGIYFSQNIELPIKQKKIIVMNICCVPPRELLNKKIKKVYQKSWKVLNKYLIYKSVHIFYKH